MACPTMAVSSIWAKKTRMVKEATLVLVNKGLRTGIVLKADIRPGYTNRLTGKIEKINNILGTEDDH